MVTRPGRDLRVFRCRGCGGWLHVRRQRYVPCERLAALRLAGAR